MKHWKIKVFIKDRGTNVIKDWFEKDNIPKQAQATINTRLKYMVTLKVWGRPYSAKRKGTEYIHEVIIKWKRNQYRPLGFFGPREGEFTLLIGAKEKDSKLIPKDADAIAEQRRKIILEDGGNIDDYFQKL